MERTGILDKNALDQGACFDGNLSVNGPLIHIVSYAFINGFDIFGLERRTSNDESVKDDTNGPCINFEAMTVHCIEQNFGSNVVGSATNCSE